MNCIAKTTLTLAVVLVSYSLFAQNPEIDSLQIELEKAETDTSRVNVLNELALKFYRIEPEKTLEYAKQAMELSLKNDYQKGIAEAHRMIGTYLETQGNYDSALYEYEMGLEIFEKIADLKGQSDMTNDLGVLYLGMSDYPKAYGYLEKSKSINREMGNDYGVARAMLNMGIILTNQGKFEKSLTTLEDALEVFAGLEHLMGQAICLSNIGIIYKERGDFDEALVRYNIALETAMKMGNKFMQAKINNNLGVIHEEKAEYAQATEVYLKALDLYDELGSQEGKVETLANIGIIYKEMGEYDKAIEYYQQAVEINKSLGGGYDLSLNYIDLASVNYSMGKYAECLRFYRKSYDISTTLDMDCGLETPIAGMGIAFLAIEQYDSAQLYLVKGYDLARRCENFQELSIMTFNLYRLNVEMKNTEKAIDYITESFELSKNYGFNLELRNSAYELYTYEKERGNYRKALDYHEVYQVTNDSIYNTSTTKKIANLTSRFEFEAEKKELQSEIDLLSAETKIQELEIERNNIQLAGIGAGAVLLVIAVIALYSRRNYKLKVDLAAEKEAQQKLRFKAVIEAEEKERKRIAQELHDGLGQLLSTARLNVSVLEDEDEQKQAQVVNSLKLIDSAVSEVRTISHNMMPNALISIGFEAALREQVHLINEAGKVAVHLNLPEEKMQLEESRSIGLYRIIQEVLNNALKYSDAKNIWVDIQTRQEELSVIIKDDGKGFDTEVIESSAGIGWSNIISRVDILDGTLVVNSNMGEGSEVSLKVAV